MSDEVKRLRSYELATPAPGVPPCAVHRYPRFTLTLRVVGDPQRDVLLLDVVLASDEALRPYALLAPHLGGTGHDNVAEVARHGSRRVLRAGRESGGRHGLALAAAAGLPRDAWGRASAGFVGASDGWRDVADAPTRPISLGLHVARLPTAALDARRSPDFTWRWEGSGARAGGDCRLRLDGAASAVTSASSRWPRRRSGS